MKKDTYAQARITQNLKKQLAMYAVRHDTSVQRIIEDYVQTLVDLDISPKDALTAIREKAQKKPGE